MNKMLVSALSVLGLSASAFAGGLPEEMPLTPCAASDAGVYVGVNLGLGMTNYKNLEKKGLEIKGDNHFAGRVFFGYDINRFFATEFGYSAMFGKAEAKTTTETKKLRMNHTFDLFGKIKAPVVSNLDLYGKLGVSLLMGSSTDIGNATEFKKQNIFNLAFGAGVDFAVTPNIIANVEWVRYNGKAKLDKQTPFADMFMAGVRYKFEL